MRDPSKRAGNRDDRRHLHVPLIRISELWAFARGFRSCAGSCDQRRNTRESAANKTLQDRLTDGCYRNSRECRGDCTVEEVVTVGGAWREPGRRANMRGVAGPVFTDVRQTLVQQIRIYNVAASQTKSRKRVGHDSSSPGAVIPESSFEFVEPEGDRTGT